MKKTDFIINNETLIHYLGDESHVVIPEGVTKLPADSLFFNKCYSVVLPSTLTEISKQAFSTLSHLVEIYNLSDLDLDKDYFEFEEYTERPLVIHNSLYEPSVLTFIDDFIFIKENTSIMWNN